MDKNEILNKLDFYGNFVLHNYYIYAHAVLTDNNRCIISNETGFFVLYNPRNDNLVFYREKNKGKVRLKITDDEKAFILNKVKIDYFKKYDRDLVDVWREIAFIKGEMYA